MKVIIVYICIGAETFVYVSLPDDVSGNGSRGVGATVVKSQNCLLLWCSAVMCRLCELQVGKHN